MRPRPAPRFTWHRPTIALTALCTWISAVACFGGSAVALSESLVRERWILGGLGWAVGLATFLLVGKCLGRD